MGARHLGVSLGAEMPGQRTKDPEKMVKAEKDKESLNKEMSKKGDSPLDFILDTEEFRKAAQAHSNDDDLGPIFQDVSRNGMQALTKYTADTIGRSVMNRFAAEIDKINQLVQQRQKLSKS